MSKVKTFAQVWRAVQKDRKAGKKIVATNGCFDILHVGHVQNLENAKKLGDVLVVGVNSDASVRKNKGPLRPIIPVKDRAALLAALRCVDYVFIFSEKTPFAWIQKLKPDVHVKAEDTKKHPDFKAQKEAIKKTGGKFMLVPLVPGRSTTKIIETVVARYSKQKTK